MSKSNVTGAFRLRVLSDSDGSKNEMQIQADGFKECWAYATADEYLGFWEFDLHRLDGVEMHFCIGYTINPDILETAVGKCIRKFMEDA